MSKYTLPVTSKPADTPIQNVMYRIPDRETQDAFNIAVKKSGTSAQSVIDSMVKHCLREAGLLAPQANAEERA